MDRTDAGWAHLSCRAGGAGKTRPVMGTGANFALARAASVVKERAGTVGDGSNSTRVAPEIGEACPILLQVVHYSGKILFRSA